VSSYTRRISQFNYSKKQVGKSLASVFLAIDGHLGVFKIKIQNRPFFVLMKTKTNSGTEKILKFVYHSIGLLEVRLFFPQHKIV